PAGRWRRGGLDSQTTAPAPRVRPEPHSQTGDPVKTSLVRSALVASGLVLAGLAAHAAEDAAKVPPKTMTLVVPYAPGGSSDTRARMLAAKMSATLGQTIIVENKAGGGGNIGTSAIAHAAPDGYTFGIGNFAPLSVNKAMMPKMTFDPQKDLAP